MKVTKLIVSVWIAFWGIAALASPPGCEGGPLGVASPFNLFVLGDVHHANTDTEGRVAAGGNAYFDHYSIGEKVYPEISCPYSLVVGGNLEFTNGNVYGGPIAYGGWLGMSSYDSTAYDGAFQGQPIDFAAAATGLDSVSASLSALAVNGKTAVGDKQITLTGSDATAVFSVDAADLSRVTFLRLEVQPGAVVVVKVNGNPASLHDFGFDPGNATPGKTLFFFPQATSLSLTHIGVPGTVFAPLADVVFTSGAIHGQLIAHSLTGDGQLNLPLFGSCLARSGATKPSR
jgi:choice-of-anchor A domain-containing protein